MATLLLLAGAWSVAALALWESTVPDGLRLPELRADQVLAPSLIHRAEGYARFHRLLWILSTVSLLAVLGYYALRGGRFARESAAGRIGTGMLLAMLGFALAWLVEAPFRLLANWWDRRHGVSRLGYLELLFGDYLALAAQFLFLSLAVLIVMGLAGVLGGRWWMAAAPVFVGLAALFLFLMPYLVTDTRPVSERSPLAADVRQLAARQDVGGLRVRVEEVDRYTSAANAYATGLGPSRSVFLWNTLLDGRFSRSQIRVVLAHELAHHARGHLWKGIAWYALLAVPGTYLIALATRRRGGMARAEAVPLSLLVLAALTLAASPLHNLISRRLEAEADWEALRAARDPDAASGLFRRLAETALADPTPPGWAYVLLESHPSLLERVAMARAWRQRHPRARPLALPRMEP